MCMRIVRTAGVVTFLTVFWVGVCMSLGASVALAGEAGPEEAPSDPFAGALVETNELSAVRGGESLAIDGHVGINLAEQHGSVQGNVISAPTTTGGVAGNAINGNSGVTISNFNSGNFNNFQSSVQYNIFLD